MCDYREPPGATGSGSEDESSHPDVLVVERRPRQPSRSSTRAANTAGHDLDASGAGGGAGAGAGASGVAQTADKPSHTAERQAMFERWKQAEGKELTQRLLGVKDDVKQRKRRCKEMVSAANAAKRFVDCHTAPAPMLACVFTKQYWWAWAVQRNRRGSHGATRML